MSDPFDEMDPTMWASTPCTAGRVATEVDVEEGRAVFNLEGQSTVAQFPVPCCALHLAGDDEGIPCIVIQAEVAEMGTLLGVRYLFGGFGICPVDEVQLFPAGWPAEHAF